MKGLTNYIIIILLLVLIALTLRNNKEEIDINTALAEQTLEVIPVNVAPVEKSSVDRSIELAGMITPAQNLILMAEAQGRVKQTLVNEGQEISSGDVVAILDDSYLRSELQRLNASLEKLSKDLERSKILAENKAITNQQLEGAQLQYDNVKTQYDILQRHISDARVKSPINGIVSKLMVKQGDMVGAGVPVAQILNQSSFNIRFAVSDIDIANLRTGQALSLTDIGYQDITGVISKVAISKNRMGKYDVEGTLSNYENSRLKADMLRNASIEIADSTEYLILPSEALLYSNEARGIYQITNNSATFKALQVIDIVNGQALVAGDISVGDLVVTEGQYRVSEGAEVKVVY
ncbi:MAG: efflux RND transporter periplasmic adaptor subunit [Bacteroidota bacterium]